MNRLNPYFMFNLALITPKTNINTAKLHRYADDTLLSSVGSNTGDSQF